MTTSRRNVLAGAAGAVAATVTAGGTAQAAGRATASTAGSPAGGRRTPTKEPFGTLPDGTDDSDVSVRIDAFPAVVAAGVDEATALVLAVSQRPLSALAHGEVATEEAWATKPSWGLVAVEDLVKAKRLFASDTAAR